MVQTVWELLLASLPLVFQLSVFQPSALGVLVSEAAVAVSARLLAFVVAEQQLPCVAHLRLL